MTTRRDFSARARVVALGVADMARHPVIDRAAARPSRVLREMRRYGIEPLSIHPYT